MVARPCPWLHPKKTEPFQTPLCDIGPSHPTHKARGTKEDPEGMKPVSTKIKNKVIRAFLNASS